MIVPGGLVGGMGPVPLNHRFRVSLRTFAWHLRHLIHTQADLELVLHHSAAAGARVTDVGWH